MAAARPLPPEPTMNRIPFVSRTLDVVQWLGLVIGVAMIVAMAVLMNVEIAGRTLLGVSTQMSDEFAGYFFTAATMLCFLPALREGRFLRVEGLVALAPAARPRRRGSLRGPARGRHLPRARRRDLGADGG